MPNSKWLSRLSGKTRLYDITIPGSHDAGVYGDQVHTVKSPASWARCQSTGIAGQAAKGSRMFDCRVFLRRVAPGPAGLVPTMGHFAREKAKHDHGARGSMGAYGGSLIACVTDAIGFVRANPTEFLILRFSHTYCPAEVGIALGQLRALGDNANFISTSSRNVAQRQLHDLRGKVIMVFASEFHANFDHTTGYLPFRKHTGAAVANGLCTCGIFKGSESIKTVHTNAEQSFVDHMAHTGAQPDHLHFVYWQQTKALGGDIKAMTREDKSKTIIGREEKDWTGGAKANLTDFADEIRANVLTNTWRRPNVISHDFVTATTCTKIIDLNPNLKP